MVGYIGVKNFIGFCKRKNRFESVECCLFNRGRVIYISDGFINIVFFFVYFYISDWFGWKSDRKSKNRFLWWMFILGDVCFDEK